MVSAQVEQLDKQQLIRAAFDAACPCFKTDIIREGFTWTCEELIEVVTSDGACLHDGDDYPYWEEPDDNFDGCRYVAKIRASHERGDLD